MKVYEFDPPEGYEWAVPALEDDYDLFTSFDGTARAGDWTAPKMVLLKEDEGRQYLPSDTPWFGRTTLVLKQKALEALGPGLASDGEMLPLACDEAALWAFNTTTILDALDVEGSESVRFSTGRIMKVKSYAFRPEQLRTVSAFKVPELLSGPVFFTENVVRQAAGLAGVGFKLLWEGAVKAA